MTHPFCGGAGMNGSGGGVEESDDKSYAVVTTVTSERCVGDDRENPSSSSSSCCSSSSSVLGGGTLAGQTDPLPPPNSNGTERLGRSLGACQAAGEVTEVTNEGGKADQSAHPSNNENSGNFSGNKVLLTLNGNATDSRQPASKLGPEVEVHEGSSLLGGSGKFEFNKLFGYYPPKLVLQDDGDLCPERSLSLNDMERQRLGTLPPDHPFLWWTLGQPSNKPNPPAIKPTRRNKIKSKSSLNVANFAT